MGEPELRPDLPDDLRLALDLPRCVLEVFELLALDVDVGSQQAKCFLRGGPLIQSHEVDAAERREGFGPQGLVECRPARTLVDEPVGCHRHDKDVAHCLRGLEILDVAGMHQIETTVAENDLLPPLLLHPEPFCEVGDFLDGFSASFHR